MKIGFSTFVMQGGYSGISTYIRELLRFLQIEDRTNRYEVLMPRQECDLIGLTNPGFSKRLSPPVVNRPLVSLAWHNSVCAKLSRDYDILHIPTARRIPLIKSTRVVATVHDLAAFSIEAKYDRPRMFFNRRMVPAMIRRADHVITVSRFTRDDLIRHAGVPEERISVIYSGIDHDLFQPMPKNTARERLQAAHGLDKPFFVYVSRLEHPGKNHIRLIEAFERFKFENDSAHQLVLAGADWPGADFIRARAAASPVRQDIIFPGFVPQKSLPLLYNACDLMIFPSLFEGFGFPILEAAACGAPVICSDTSSMKEIAGDRIPTFDPNRADAIYRAMECALSAGADEKRMQRGIEYAATFNWHETARRVMEVYESQG
ncbi:MAG: glycosyltransferase family 4 protein [Pontiellaceae bacterium]|nr:glycosyltransferase family 4 protein [Pontiellaceae bacterium]MBN2785659.1 glycosyltransferase family 4 protein [Pontiellaceae bacterium]